MAPVMTLLLYMLSRTFSQLVPTEIVTLTPGKLDPAVLVAPKEDGEATGDAAVPDISAPVPENEVPNTKRQKLT